MKATARIYFEKSPTKRTKEGFCPVKLCITFNRQRRYYSLKPVIRNDQRLYLSDEDIKKVTGASPRGKYRDIAFEYKRIIKEAENIINSLEVFSFGQFEEKYFNKPTSWDNVFKAFVNKIQQLKTEKRFGYVESFQSTLRAVKEFHEGRPLSYNCRQKVETRLNDYLSGKPLLWQDITPKWLKNFETHLTGQGKSRASIGIYMRNIRTLFNEAIKFYDVKARYPFDQYKIKTGEGRKIALTPEQISLIANFQTDDTKEQFARDMFLFSFLACGMNLSDVARLKQSNIADGEIVFIRKKTESEEARGEFIHVPVTDRMREIIDRYKNRAIGYDPYLFPVLNPEMDEESQFKAIRQFIKVVNKHIKQLAKRCGINENVTSYTARHSWATISKNSGASVEFISEMLGHSSVNVTKAYLKSFDKEHRMRHAEKIEELITQPKTAIQ